MSASVGYCAYGPHMGGLLEVELVDGVYLLAEPRHPNRCYAWMGEMSLNVSALIKGLLHPGACFLDIGAFSGQHAIRAAKVVGDAGQVVAFEPDPRARERLTRNVQRSGVSSIVSIREEAVGDSAGEVAFFISAEQSMSSLRPVADLTREREIQVTSVPLLDLILNYEPSLVKIDVEGFEAQCLSSLLGQPPKMNPIFIVENNKGVPEVLRELGWEWLETDHLFKSHVPSPNFSSDIVAAPGGVLDFEELRTVANRNLTYLTRRPVSRWVRGHRST